MSVDRALAVISRGIDDAQAEVDRLVCRVKAQADDESGRTSSSGRIPMATASTAVEDRIALRVAKAQVEALRRVETDLLRMT